MTCTMNTSLQTLLYGFDVAGVDGSASKILFMNGEYVDGLEGVDEFQQYFKPYIDVLETQNHVASADIQGEGYDIVLYLLPKNMVEARYGLARAISVVQKGGMIFCSADNKAGGTRLKKLFEEFDIGIEGHESRNKARVVWGHVDAPKADVVAEALSAGQQKPILNDRYVSQAGVFGWDKIDKGSEILTRHIPKNLKGKGADFGCGYGYLSDFTLSHCRKVKRLTCLDADYRAVEACRQNLGQYEVDLSFVWADLTRVQTDLRNLDFIVMNPPFHEGKKQDLGIGHDFIRSAYQSLKRGGALYIVANAHLSYETLLYELFFDVDKLHEGQGFKAFKAVR